MPTSASPIYARPGRVPEFALPSRPVDTVFVHCSASDSPEHDDASVIRDWHIKDRGWKDIGYHFFIKKNGTVQIGRSIENTPAAQKGFNTGSIAICLHGLDENNFTGAQQQALVDMCHSLESAYVKEAKRSLRFRGHCEVARKACPVLNYRGILDLNGNGLLAQGAGVFRSVGEHPDLVEDAEHLDLMDRGDLVRQLQVALIRRGAKIKADGAFGRATQEAVIQFQAANGLRPDGVAGPVTKKALGI